MSKFWGALVVLTLIVVVEVFNSSWPAIIVGAIVASFFSGLAKSARESERIEQQTEKDTAGTSILGLVGQPRSPTWSLSILDLNRVPVFSLFLRPFSVTRKLPVQNPYKSVGNLWAGAVGESYTIDIETLLADAFKPETPLIGLGRPGEAIGVGRIDTSEAQWKSEIEKLASAAQSIFVIPSDHEGTKWEINYLISNHLLSKTVFVMPPNGSNDVQLDWEKSRSQLPIEMPPYSKDGMLFRLSPEGKVLQFETLSVRTTAGLAKRIRNISKANKESVRYKLSDQPAFRFLGWMASLTILWPILVLIALLLFLLLSAVLPGLSI